MVQPNKSQMKFSCTGLITNMDSSIIVANGDSEFPTVYLSDVPHPSWRNNGNAYIITTVPHILTTTNAGEHIRDHGRCCTCRYWCTADKSVGTFTLNAGDAIFYRDLNGSGNPEDDQLMIWIPHRRYNRRVHPLNI